VKRRINANSVNYNKFVLIAVLLFFVVIIYRMSILSLSKTIDGVDVQAFASARNSNKEVIYARRGTVYDCESNILAQTINSYTVVAYLSNTRGTGNYVNDKEDTALKLSEIINMEYETILALLTRNAYQVELGPGGRGITELTKEKIVELNLPGIGFIPSYKRYYPNGNFASYVLGYVQIRDSGEMVGELGVELAYNNQLKGTDGSYEYQQDLYGYKMANTTEIDVNAQDGIDI
jgi:penicillin-binding protein 2B